MPTKASITTRTGKGSPLTTAEMDNNLTALRDQTIAIADDTSTAIDVESGNTLTIAGSGTVSTAASGQTLTITGTGITASSTDTLQNKTINTANNTITINEADISDLGSYITASSTDTLSNKTISSASNTITITESNISDLGSYITASSTDTLTNKTFDVEGTGNSISNIDVADFKAGVLDIDLSTVSASDDTLASAKAIKAYVDGQASGINNLVEDTTPQLGGDLDAQTNNITNLGTLNTHTVPGGTGTLALTSDTDVVNDTTPQLGGDLDVNGNSLVSVSNGNIVLAPNGTGKTKITNINYSEAAPHTVTYAATITPDVANGNIQKVTLTGNVTFSAFSNPVAGQTLTLFVVQDATGSRLLTSTMLFAGGSKTLSTAANAIDIITVFYDGTNYYANLVTNFS